MPLPLLLTLALCGGLCAFLALRQAMHMFQLNSYQDLPYQNWLRAHRSVFWSVKRLLPCALMLAGSGIGGWPMVILWVGGTALYILVNRPRPAKKPLVYTPRVRRMLICAAVLFLLWAALSDYVFSCLFFAGFARFSMGLIRLGYFLPALMMTAAILLQHRLVMVYNDLMAPVEKRINKGYENDARRILASMPQLKIIGITGSYGKTSTKYFLQQLLSTRFHVYMTPGNYNTTLGVVRAVREGLRPTHQIFLCEMGARYKGDIREICDLVHPDLGVITSVGPQHLETFGSLEGVLRTKLELADALRGKGPVFLNLDSEPLAQGEPDQERITYGQRGRDYRLCDLYVDENGSRFTVTAPDGESESFSTRLLGYANVQNICGAIAVSHHLGIPLKTLAPAVRQLEGAPHRLELLHRPGLTIIDDAYNSKPMGAKNALDTLALCRGTRIAVTPGLVELGEQELEYNEALGRQAAACCDVLITVGRQERTAAIRSGAGQAGMEAGHILSADTVQQAMEQARALPGSAKMVLLLNDLTDNY